MDYGYGNNVDVGERVICCMPCGHKDENAKRLVDFVAGKNGAKRKPLQDLLEKPDLVESVPSNIKDVFGLTKLAPSAANSQIWRFGVDDDFKNPSSIKNANEGIDNGKYPHPISMGV